MPRESNFPFVDTDTLRENLDIAFDHIIELVSLSESQDYNDVLKSSFRKTTIIYTASVIEALLFWMLKKNKTSDDLARRVKVFEITKDIYEINAEARIVLGRDVEKTEKFSFEKLNLDQINSLCKEHELILPPTHKRVDRMRLLRNKLHIGSLKEVEKNYSKRDMEFAFSVAKEVKELAKACV